MKNGWSISVSNSYFINICYISSLSTFTEKNKNRGRMLKELYSIQDKQLWKIQGTILANDCEYTFYK